MNNNKKKELNELEKAKACTFWRFIETPPPVEVVNPQRTAGYYDPRINGLSPYPVG